MNKSFVYYLEMINKLYYDALPTKYQHSYMFRHYCVMVRELVVSTLPSYTSISNAAACNKIYN